MPPVTPVQSIVIDLVMVTAPNPPGSRQSISPPAAVFEMAPAKVLQGAVRLHGLTSSPTPDTQVRVACAWAEVVGRETTASSPKSTSDKPVFLMMRPSKGWLANFTMPKLARMAGRKEVELIRVYARVAQQFHNHR